MSNNYDSDPAPSPAQVQALREIYRRLVANARWPTFDEVDRALDRVGIDLEEIARGFPPGLTNLGPRHLMGQDQLILQPEALPFCSPDSDDDRQLILRIIWLAIEADRSHDPVPGGPDTAKLTGDDLSQALGYPEARLFHLYHLLTGDYWFGGGSHNPDDRSFEFHIRRPIRKYRGVQSYADYLRVRKEIRQSQTDPTGLSISPSGPSGTSDSITPSIRPAITEADKYDVALSFAGEDRPYVARVADALKRAGVLVFYDDYERAELWGKDLASHLDTIYRKTSRFVVVFVSTHYATKVWTNVERRSALARAIKEKREFILPARFDDTDLPGIPDTIGHIDCRDYTPEELADLVVQKVGLSSPPTPTQLTRTLPQAPSVVIGARPELLITARLEQTPGNRPTSVLIRNLGDAPALNCVYVAVLTDRFDLVAWYMTNPADLDGHESREFTFTNPYGIEQASFHTYDESSASPSGQRMRRHFDVFVRAFDDDPRAAGTNWSSKVLIGLATPPTTLFRVDVSPDSAMGGREEAVIYTCPNNHLHRLLPHTHASAEQFDAGNTTLPWLDWYRQVALSVNLPPNPTLAPKPNARFLHEEPL